MAEVIEKPMLSTLEQKLWDLLNPGITDLGFRLVRVQFTNPPGTIAKLQLMIEPPSASKDNFASVTVDDCEQVSRFASAQLDVQDPIKTAYRLEVSSPGLDRPLVTLADFEAYQGRRVKVETLLPLLEDRRRFEGVLYAADGQTITLQLPEDETVKVPFAQIRRAQLVVDEALLKRVMKQRKDQDD